MMFPFRAARPSSPSLWSVGLMALAMTTLTACSGAPGAHDIQSAIETSADLSSDLPADARYRIDLDRCESVSAVDGHICQFRVLLTLDGQEQEGPWVMTRLYREADAWHVDPAMGSASTLRRDIHINTVVMGSYADELARMATLFGDDGSCEADHATHTWCRTPDQALIVGISTTPERSSFGSFVFEPGHSISARYDTTREQSGAPRRLMEEMIQAYGFTDQELGFCTGEEQYRIEGQALTLSCQTNATAVSFSISSRD